VLGFLICTPSLVDFALNQRRAARRSLVTLASDRWPSGAVIVVGEPASGHDMTYFDSLSEARKTAANSSSQIDQRASYRLV